MPSISGLLDWASGELKSVSDTPRLDAKVLLRHVTNLTDADLITRSNQKIDTDLECRYKKLVTRRKAGEPVAYLTGAREFWSLELKVTEDTLIPRPETELLVETALALMKKGRRYRVLDLGTGTGAIALAIASERPLALLTATDTSRSALEVASQNAVKLELTNIEFVHSSWFESLGGREFDVIISNPPYVAAGDRHLREDDVRFEPVKALVSGVDGLDDLNHIIGRSQRFLKTSGYLLVEHGYHQGDSVRHGFEKTGYCNIRQCSDLSGVPRITAGQSPGHRIAERGQI